MNRNCPWGSPNFVLYTSYYKYARGKGSHVQRTKGNQENDVSPLQNISKEIEIIKRNQVEILELKSITEIKNFP